MEYWEIIKKLLCEIEIYLKNLYIQKCSYVDNEFSDITFQKQMYQLTRL